MKLSYGVGYNSGGEYKSTVNNKVTKAHIAWLSMMRRCYDSNFHKDNHTYKDCVACPDWNDFQLFARWFYNHPYSNLGYDLDKDLLVVGNKLYSPETCCFVPHELNQLLVDSGKIRGKYPIGVSWQKQISKYRAYVTIENKQKHLGTFHCPNEAHQAYVVAKEAHVKVKANQWRDRIAPEVFDALMAWTVASTVR